MVHHAESETQPGACRGGCKPRGIYNEANGVGIGSSRGGRIARTQCPGSCWASVDTSRADSVSLSEDCFMQHTLASFLSASWHMKASDVPSERGEASLGGTSCNEYRDGRLKGATSSSRPPRPHVLMPDMAPPPATPCRRAERIRLLRGIEHNIFGADRVGMRPCRQRPPVLPLRTHRHRTARRRFALVGHSPTFTLAA